VSPDVAKKNFVKHCGLELVESLFVSVGLEAAEIEALWESFDDVFHFVESVIPLSDIGPLPEIVLAQLPHVVCLFPLFRALDHLVHLLILVECLGCVVDEVVKLVVAISNVSWQAHVGVCDETGVSHNDGQ
jgi:hypothetical protein